MWESLLKKLHSLLLSSSPIDKLELPKVPELVVASSVIRQEVEGMQLKMMYPALLDEFQTYHHTTLAGWIKAIKYIYVAFKFPEYVPARKDCEFFALLFKGLVSAFFGFNACAFIIGDSPNGVHGYDLLRTEKGYYIWEADPKFGWKTPLKLGGQFDYIPQYILI